MYSRTRSLRRSSTGFTLVELMVATFILVLLLGIIATVMQSSTKVIHQASSKLSTFATARSAFDTVTEKLSQATLNTYWDYYNAAGSRLSQANSASFVPSTYGRASDLQFFVQQNTQNSGCGEELYFQSPQAFSSNSNYQSTQGLLNACGFYVEYGNNSSFLPTLFGTQQKWRYRLMQGMEPTENLQIFQATSLTSNATSDNPQTWISNIKNNGVGTLANYVVPLADNVICMVVWPRLPEGQDATGTSLTTNYAYDSQANVGAQPQPITANQLPPTIQVTLVAMDEASAIRIDTRSATPPPAITTALAQNGGLFKKVANYQSDLTALQTALAASHINFEVLNTTVVMRESKWSQ